MQHASETCPLSDFTKMFATKVPEAQPQAEAPGLRVGDVIVEGLIAMVR